MKNRLRNERGMTLIEMVAAVAVIGIVSSMSYPSFEKAVDRLEFKSNSREMLSTFRMARSLAITEKNDYGICLQSGATHTVTLFKDIANPGLNSYEFGDSVISVDTLGKDMIWIGSDCVGNVATFKPNGSSGFTGGGNFWTVAVTEALTGVSMHSVLASTGRVNAQNWVY
jgi:prepilin-type N-terminal cleavage/methylation domain-containing protein